MNSTITMPFITLDNSNQVFYKEIGKPDGTPIVFIHGWLCNGEFWEDFEVLEDNGYRLIIPDLRGHGKTPLFGRITIENMADDIVKIIESLNISRAVVIGHSMGGLIAQEVYHRIPDKVIALGLWNTGGRIPFGYGIRGLFYYTNVLLSAIGLIMSYPIKPLFSWMLAKGWAVCFYKMGRSPAYKKLVHHVREMDPKAALKAAGAIRKYNGIPKLPEIKVPTMLLHGNKDRFTTPKFMIELLNEKIPDSYPYYAPKSAHFAPNEQPDLVLEYLNEFLDKIKP